MGNDSSKQTIENQQLILQLQQQLAQQVLQRWRRGEEHSSEETSY